jgi:hypothetical protein
MQRWNISALVIGVALAAAAPLAAQQQASASELAAAQRTAMARLAWMDGEWRGPAVTQTADGEHRVIQTERIGGLLDGTIKVIEGRGFNPDGTKGFNAFGVISYDPSADAFEFRSYAQGRSGTFTITPTGDGYVWEIPAGPATIRYTASVANGTWTEVGDRLVEGRPPARFFEMKLQRIGDSAWPEAGALTAR